MNNIGFSLIYSIVPKNCGELVTCAATEAGAGGGSVLMGKGTASNSILQLLGFGDSDKDISLNVVPDDIVPTVIETIKKTAEKKPHFGILFTTRVTHFSKTNSDSTGDSNMNAEYQLITAIVNKGYAEDAMAAARKAGAGGGTIIGARGTARDFNLVAHGDRLRLQTDFVHRQIPADRSRVRRAEIAVATGIDAGISDVERRIDAHRLAVVAPPRELRLRAHLRHKRIRGGRDEIQKVEPVVLVLRKRRGNHLRRHLRVVGLDLFLRVF